MMVPAISCSCSSPVSAASSDPQILSLLILLLLSRRSAALALNQHGISVNSVLILPISQDRQAACMLALGRDRSLQRRPIRRSPKWSSRSQTMPMAYAAPVTNVRQMRQTRWRGTWPDLVGIKVGTEWTCRGRKDDGSIGSGPTLNVPCMPRFLFVHAQRKFREACSETCERAPPSITN